MAKKQAKVKKSSIFPLFVLSIVLIGLFVLISQVNQQQNVETKAQAFPTPDQSTFNPNAPPTNCPNTAADLQISANEQALFDAINQYRMQNNLGPVMYTQELKKSAKWYSKDLSQNNVQMPNGIDSFNRPLENRLFDCVVNIDGEFRENVIIAPSAAEALNQMRSTPDGNGDLLSPTADLMAIGNTGNYWVVDLASPPGSPPNQPVAPVNNGAAPIDNGGGGAVIPSPACLGSCPPGTDTGGTAGTGQAPTPCPSTTVTANSVGENDIEATHKKKKKKNRGGGGGGGTIKNDGAVLQQLIKLLEELIKLLGGTVPSGGTGAKPC